MCTHTHQHTHMYKKEREKGERGMREGTGKWAGRPSSVFNKGQGTSLDMVIVRSLQPSLARKKEIGSTRDGHQ